MIQHNIISYHNYIHSYYYDIVIFFFLGGGEAENARLENAAPNCRTGKRGKRRVWKAKMVYITMLSRVFRISVSLSCHDLSLSAVKTQRKLSRGRRLKIVS